MGDDLIDIDGAKIFCLADSSMSVSYQIDRRH